MTEHEWLSCADPTRLLKLLGDDVSARKAVIQACHWGRLVKDLWYFNKAILQLIDAAESFVEHSGAFGEVAAAAARIRSQCERLNGYPPVGTDAYWALCLSTACAGQGKEACAAVWDTFELGSCDTQWELLVALIRDIFGNPFRPVVFDPTWRTPSVSNVALAIYEERRFADMPILADALEEAGCTNVDVLDHCRGGGEHTRGCWLVDLVLERA
jgi:hypothetical protein